MPRCSVECLFRLLTQTRPFPEAFVPQAQSHQHHVFYTDGSADFSNKPAIRRAAFGVVQDCSPAGMAYHIRCQHANDAATNTMRVVSMAMCPQNQNVPRAELSAVVQVAESMCVHRPACHYTIYTDAQYVVDVIDQHVRDTDSLPHDHHTANMDIIQRLRTFWKNDLGQVVKVEAHQDISSMMDSEQKWHAIGNEVADMAAKKARDNEIDDVIRASSRLRSHDDESTRQLGDLFRYLADLPRYRLQLLDQQKSQEESEPVKDHVGFLDAFGQHAVDYLGKWQPDTVTALPWSCPDDSIFQAISSGAVFAKHVWFWLHTLRWSDEQSKRPSTDWGVSWLELVINFRLVTRCDIPIMMEWDHATASAEWLWPSDDSKSKS